MDVAKVVSNKKVQSLLILLLYFKGGDGSVGIKGDSALFSEVIDLKNQTFKTMILEKNIYTR